MAPGSRAEGGGGGRQIEFKRNKEEEKVKLKWKKGQRGSNALGPKAESWGGAKSNPSGIRKRRTSN